MTKTDLTEQQEKFLDALFSLNKETYPTQASRLREAAKIAGYSENTNPYNILKGMKTEIISKVEEYLAINAPQAVINLMELMDDPTMPGGKQLLDTIVQVLDRAGIVKKDKIEVESNAPTHVIIMPSKNSN